MTPRSDEPIEVQIARIRAGAAMTCVLLIAIVVVVLALTDHLPW